MQKIVLDTNVLISALIGSSHPTRILNEIVFDNKVIVALSNQVFEEYISVLHRDKFKRYEGFLANAQIVINRIYDLSLHYSPSIKFEILSDESDNKFIELAIASDADFLVTGNTNDFKFSKLGKLKILTPQEFMHEWDKKHP